MRWKLTGRFLMAIICTVFCVILVNGIISIVLYVYHISNEDRPTSATDFTRSLARYIAKIDEEPQISDEGIAALQERNAWLQFLDDNGNVIGHALAPAAAPQHYTPIELIQAYKYRDKNQTTTLVAEHNGVTYLVGIQDASLSKIIITSNTSSITQFIAQFALIIIIVDIVIAIIIGFIFSSFLAKPIYRMIERIRMLKNRNFAVDSKRSKGLYRSIFHNLDDVAESLKLQEEERHKLEQMRNEWISNVSHDMKTPLAAIQGYAELLQGDVSTQEQSDYAEIIEKKSVYMRELLDDFTLTMRLRQQEMPLQLVDTNIVSFVRELVIDVLNDTTFSGSEITFNSQFDKLTKSIDTHLMKRALLNFIYNALVHNEGNVTLDISIEEMNEVTVITISDNGKGIAEADLPQVFERYYRGTNTRNIKGTGLGMAIARDVIQAHGGEVELVSEIGVGTTIIVRL
ncbi:sensor histidine kinase [Metasolibacillus meyeri]|uniref:sensor histidine kinase n=1 Tax=Metasolibacillus meyeri TaxID=1071052 RepID=UPI000D30A066|nr:HAMP domain-containing sensor histidine kinase [Metasolibacillus meyeri]